MLPALDRLSLLRTGEFYPLNQPELDEFTAEEKVDPITLDPFKRDADGWRTFRVRNATPQSNGEYKYHYYKASALWQHYDSQTPKKDPLTNQPIWYEDWMALHDVYDPFPNAVELIPGWVYTLPTREPGTVKAQPPPPPPPRVFAPPSWVTPGELRVRRMETLEETPPSSPTPIWVHRQPNRPQRTTPPEDLVESERLYAVRNRARERFDRLLRTDDANTVNALEQAMGDVERAGEAIQEFLDRRAADENDPNGLRTLQARSERYGTRDMAERMQRQFDEARARWEATEVRNENLATIRRMEATWDRNKARFDRLLRLDDPTTLEPLLRAIDIAKMIDQTQLEAMERIATLEDPDHQVHEMVRESRIESQESVESMQRKVDEARARWQGNIPNSNHFLEQVGAMIMETANQGVDQLRATYNRAKERFDRLIRLDNPDSLNALQQALRDAQLTGQVFEHRLIHSPASVEVRMHLWMRQHDEQSMVRQVDEARARWGGRTMPAPYNPFPRAEQDGEALYERLSAIPLSEEGIRERHRIFLAAEREWAQEQEDADREIADAFPEWADEERMGMMQEGGATENEESDGDDFVDQLRAYGREQRGE